MVSKELVWDFVSDEGFEESWPVWLKGLPAEPFVVGRWERYKLGPDYHVRIDGVAYSAPFGLIGKPVDVHCTRQPDHHLPPRRALRLPPAKQAGARPATLGLRLTNIGRPSSPVLVDRRDAAEFVERDKRLDAVMAEFLAAIPPPSGRRLATADRRAAAMALDHGRRDEPKLGAAAVRTVRVRRRRSSKT